MSEFIEVNKKFWDDVCVERDNLRDEVLKRNAELIMATDEISRLKIQFEGLQDHYIKTNNEASTQRLALAEEVERLKADVEAFNEEIAACRTEAKGLIHQWKSKAEKLAEALRYYKESYDDKGFDEVAKEALAAFETKDIVKGKIFNHRDGMKELTEFKEGKWPDDIGAC